MCHHHHRVKALALAKIRARAIGPHWVDEENGKPGREREGPVGPSAAIDNSSRARRRSTDPLQARARLTAHFLMERKGAFKFKPSRRKVAPARAEKVECFKQAQETINVRALGVASQD
ncbi:hypothetical protein NL676_031209 [Syzygium grande]|nr:hypothetical protein NL676_031209 [Syzygium grande]